MHNLSTKITQVLELAKQAYSTRFTERGDLYIYKRLPKAPDLLIVTLAIVMEQIGVHSEYQLYEQLDKDAPDYFAMLPKRCNFNRRRRRLFPIIDEFANFLACEMTTEEDVFIIDSTPIEVCRFARFERLKIMQDKPDFRPTKSKNHIDNTWYAGYKLHAVTSSKGVIINYRITQAHVHDVNMLQPLAKSLPTESELIGDKGYIGESRQLEIFSDNQVKVYTASRKNQKATPFPITKGKQRVRRRIETCFSQLKDQYRMIANYAKSVDGFKTRIVSKIAAFTVAQYLNFINSEPLGKVKYAY
jgi:hypothetical protein